MSSEAVAYETNFYQKKKVFHDQGEQMDRWIDYTNPHAI